MAKNDLVYRTLVEIMDRHPGVRLGIADIEYTELSVVYSHALGFAIPHRKTITLEN